MEKNNARTYDFIQSFLFSAVITCMLYALTTLIWGENNFFQNSPFPGLVVLIMAGLGWWRLGKSS